MKLEHKPMHAEFIDGLRAVAVLAAAAFVPDAWLSAAIPETGYAAFFGLSNFMLAADSGSYFSPVAEFNPFTHTWSLAVEEQFYVVAAF